MAYFITLTSDYEDINNTPDTYRMVLVFIVNDTGANQAYTFEEKGLLITDHGKTKWEYKIEDLLVTPASSSFSILDSTGYIRGLLFGTSAEQEATLKQFQVSVQLNGTNDFIGYAIEDGIEARLISSDDDAWEVTFTAYPQIELIHKQMLYDDNDVSLNPFGYTDNTSVKITEQITNIYELINGSISVDFKHNWVFEEDPAGFPTDVAFTDLAERVDRIYFDNDIPEVRSCADILKKFAEEYGAYTGLLDQNNAFFYKLFRYDSGDLQTIGKVLQRTESYAYNKIYYVKATDYLGNIGVAGDFTRGIDNQFMDITNAYRLLSHITLFGELNKSKDPDFSTPVYQDLATTLAQFWNLHRGGVTRADTFVVEGVDYNYLKNFNTGGFKYQIIELEKDWALGRSTIKALNLGTL